MTLDQFGNWLRAEALAMAKVVMDGRVTVD